MPETDIKTLIRRADRLKSDRSSFESQWQEIRNFILPLAQSFTGRDSIGAKGRTEVLDNSTESASELLAAALHGFLVNPGTRWFGLRVDDAELNRNADVVLWLEDATERMFRVFEAPEAGFAVAIGQVFQELVDFGTAGLFIADRPGRLPLFQTRPLAELYPVENGDGRIDTLYRRFRPTAEQVVAQFGNAAGRTAVQKAGRSPDERLDYLEVILPRFRREPGRLGALNMPFARLVIALQDKHLVTEGGFDEFPLAIPRWRKGRVDEVFGRGPGMKALADVKMLQRAMKATIRAAEKLVDPTLLVADDGVLGPVRTSAGGINHIRSDLLGLRQKAIQALETGGRPDIGEEFMLGIRQRVERAYYNHLIQLSRDPRMTATQVLKIDEESLRVLGPFLGRVQSELLGPVIDRLFGIMFRAGMFLPAPPALEAGRRIEIEYVSPIAKAQRLSEAAAVGTLNDLMAPVIQVDPEVLDNLDTDKTYRNTGDRLGVPAELMREPEAVAARRQARAEARQAQAEAEQAEKGAAAAQSLGQAAAAFAGAERTAGQREAA